MSLESTIEKALNKALGSAAMREGMGALAVGWMRRHISDGKGAAGDFLPLKKMERRKKRKRGGDRVEPSFRDGEKPLIATGAGVRSLKARAVRMTGGGLDIQLFGNDYLGYQDSGFSTLGPNYIPLSLKGRRGHATGANPGMEGLLRGWDYVIAPNGVEVPARPFLAPDDDDLQELAATVYTALKSEMEA